MLMIPREVIRGRDQPEERDSNEMQQIVLPGFGVSGRFQAMNNGRALSEAEGTKTICTETYVSLRLELVCGSK